LSATLPPMPAHGLIISPNLKTCGFNVGIDSDMPRHPKRFENEFDDDFLLRSGDKGAMLTLQKH
jgi:hypothetical protein